jgi:hypothetical protein
VVLPLAWSSSVRGSLGIHTFRSSVTSRLRSAPILACNCPTQEAGLKGFPYTFRSPAPVPNCQTYDPFLRSATFLGALSRGFIHQQPRDRIGTRQERRRGEIASFLALHRFCSCADWRLIGVESGWSVCGMQDELVVGFRTWIREDVA